MRRWRREFCGYVGSRGWDTLQTSTSQRRSTPVPQHHPSRGPSECYAIAALLSSVARYVGTSYHSGARWQSLLTWYSRHQLRTSIFSI